MHNHLVGTLCCLGLLVIRSCPQRGNNEYLLYVATIPGAKHQAVHSLSMIRICRLFSLPGESRPDVSLRISIAMLRVDPPLTQAMAPTIIALTCEHSGLARRTVKCQLNLAYPLQIGTVYILIHIRTTKIMAPQYTSSRRSILRVLYQHFRRQALGFEYRLCA